MTDIQEVLFINPTEESSYCIFPASYEKDDNIVFHGTSILFFKSITQFGLQSAKIINQGELSSVSLTLNSGAALRHACEKWVDDDRVVFAVNLKSIEPETVVNNTSVLYIFDPNPKPIIIAYCVVPKDYQMI